MNLMVVTWYTSVTHDSVLMLLFSCSHRPGVCITMPTVRLGQTRYEIKGLANFHILITKLNSHHTLCRYQCTTVGNRYVWQGGQTENQGGQTIFFSALRAEFYQTNVCPPWPETVPAPLQSPPLLSPSITPSVFHSRLKLISFANLFLHSLSGSFRTAFTDIEPVQN